MARIRPCRSAVGRLAHRARVIPEIVGGLRAGIGDRRFSGIDHQARDQACSGGSRPAGARVRRLVDPIPAPGEYGGCIGGASREAPSVPQRRGGPGFSAIGALVDVVGRDVDRRWRRRVDHERKDPVERLQTAPGAATVVAALEHGSKRTIDDVGIAGIRRNEGGNFLRCPDRAPSGPGVRGCSQDPRCCQQKADGRDAPKRLPDHVASLSLAVIRPPVLIRSTPAAIGCVPNGRRA